MSLGAPISMALMLLGVLFGATLAWTRFSFASSYRSMMLSGDSAGIRAQVIAIALVSTFFYAAYFLLPEAGFSFSLFVLPAGVAVAAGAFMFGIGMQLANGCGSGTLVALGSGSIRMMFVLPAFIAGSFWGTLDTEFWSRLPAPPPIMLGESLGWLPTALLYWIVLQSVWSFSRKTSRVPGRLVVGAVLLAVLNFMTLVVSGHPWGITWGFALLGAKLALKLGWSPESAPFWSEGWASDALAAPALDDSTVLMDIGILLGALGVAVLTDTFGRFDRPAGRQLVAAVAGGLLMGYGARISGGCNVGAFFSGIASFSLHGWLWIVSALIGVWVGLKIRPYFGFSDTRPPTKDRTITSERSPSTTVFR